MNWKQILGYAVGGASATLGGGKASDFINFMEAKKQREQQVKSKFLSDFMTIIQLPPGPFRAEGLRSISKSYEQVTGKPIAKGFISVMSKLDDEYSANLQFAIKDALRTNKQEDINRAIELAGRGTPGDLAYVYRFIQYGAQLRQARHTNKTNDKKDQAINTINTIKGNDLESVKLKRDIALKSGLYEMARSYERDANRLSATDNIITVVPMNDAKRKKPAYFGITKSGKIKFLGDKYTKGDVPNAWEIAKNAAGYRDTDWGNLTPKQNTEVIDIYRKIKKSENWLSGIMDGFNGNSEKIKALEDENKKLKEGRGFLSQTWHWLTGGNNQSTNTEPSNNPSSKPRTSNDEFNEKVRNQAKDLLPKHGENLSPKESGKKILELKKKLRKSPSIEERKRIAAEIDRIRKEINKSGRK